MSKTFEHSSFYGKVLLMMFYKVPRKWQTTSFFRVRHVASKCKALPGIARSNNLKLSAAKLQWHAFFL